MISEFFVAAATEPLRSIAVGGTLLGVLVFVLWKDEHLEEIGKLVELAGLAVNILGYLMVLAMVATRGSIPLYSYLALVPFLVGGILQLKPYSLRFELENINKWPTAEIMIRYSSTLRYYLARSKEHLFKVWIHGYMEIHRQKCDNIACPSRTALTEQDQHYLSTKAQPNAKEQIVRTMNIVKVIFNAGHKLSPVPGELQLEYATFLYQRGELELALRKLLMIHEEELSLDRFYVHQFLKERIAADIKGQGQLDFLDLVTEITLQREEEMLMKRFERAALMNL
jgi:hypothetical protein